MPTLPVGLLSEDADWFEELFARLYPRVMAYFVRRAQPSDVEDLAAEVLIVAWRRRGDQVLLNDLAWVYGVCRRVLLAHQRRMSTAPILSGDTPMADAARYSVVDPTTAVDQRELVRSALSTLTATERDALLLVEWEGTSARVAARVLGCSAGALRVRLHRARRKFAIAIADLELDDRTGL